MRKLLICSLLFCGALSLRAQEFKVVGTEIKDPEGNNFLIKGVNVNGPYWPWNRSTVLDVDKIVNTWKFNAVRVTCYPSLQSTFPNNNPDLDAIVTTFTSRKIVAIIENHDFTGSYPNESQLADLVTWWKDKANKYKGNSYVWFNIVNEPGGGGDAPEIWKTFHEAVIKAIREAGANNIIVLDGHAFGQENGYYKESDSGIQTYGEYFVSTYSNIAFSLHLYSTWIYGKERFIKYIDDANAKGLSIMIGEYGAAEDASNSIAAYMFDVLLEKNIGRLVWQWDGSDIHQLTNGGGGWQINSTTSKPTNLSFVGNLVWKDTHNELTKGSSDFILHGPWVQNIGFERDLEGWFGFGNQTVEKEKAQVHSGSKAFRINAGGDGGAAQPIYLVPDSTYVLSAWGKVGSTSQPGTVTVRYKSEGVEQTAMITFSENTYSHKQVEFTVPHKVEEASIVIYRAANGDVFHIDDIDLIMKGDVVTGLKKKDDTEVVVYPNPTNRQFQVKSVNSINRIIVRTVLGQVVDVPFKRVDPNVVEVDSSTLASGIYKVMITDEVGRTTQQTLIKY